MSYGRYNDAEMILKRAFQENPEKIEIHTKFLELYYKTKRPTEFQDIFMHDDMVHMRNNISGEDLVQAKAWGREIDPENPIYTELGVSTEGIVPLLETHEV